MTHKELLNLIEQDNSIQEQIDIYKRYCDCSHQKEPRTILLRHKNNKGGYDLLPYRSADLSCQNCIMKKMYEAFSHDPEMVERIKKNYENEKLYTSD